MLPHEHYMRSEVQREILDFCRGRWIALHYINADGNLAFKRYINNQKPIKIDCLEDLEEINNGTLRSIYATANIYRRLCTIEDLYDQENIIYCTPTWDIDSELSNWRETLRVTKKIIRFLSEWGITKSVYIKWSGNGCHIHINERGISESFYEKYNPLDIAYAIVEYVNSKLPSRFTEPLLSSGVIVENKIDFTRVFTCPLSLHRELDVVCICMKTEDLEMFRPEWISPQSFRHNPNWREYKEGEVDDLAEKAYKTIGGYLSNPRRKKRKTKPLDKQILEWLQKE